MDTNPNKSEPREQQQPGQTGPNYVPIFVSLVAILIAYILFVRLRRKTQNVVLLIGLSGAGKTAIFTKLIFNKKKQSVSSLKENDATNKDLNLRLIDIPGAERLRNNYWEQYRSTANSVIFVVDSVCVEDNLRDVSEYIYSIISDPLLHKNKILFTIACNKQDLDDAKKKDEITHLVEREVNAIKATKKGQLGKTSDEEEEDFLLKHFADVDEFQLDQLGVRIIETSIHELGQLLRIVI